MVSETARHLGVPSHGGGDAGGHPNDPNNMEVTQIEPRNSVCIRGDGLSAAVIQQTVNALPIQPDTISDIKGPVLKLKRVDSTSVDVKIVHSFTAHYLPQTHPHFDPPTRPLLGAPSPPSAGPAFLSHASPYTPALLRAAPEAPSYHPSLPVPASPAAPAGPLYLGSHQLAHPMDMMDDGIDCQPVVVDFEENPDDVRTRAAAGCSCPGQAMWELDASQILMGRRIGVGGFSEVFVAKYEGTLVAVKRLLSSGRDTARQLCTEVALLAQLRHPNLLLFMGYTTRPQLSIVCEFMARGSLFHIMRAQEAGHPLESRLQRMVAISVARGMLYLHTRSPPILHLDLKSPNILVDDRWRVKIADFGLSKVRASSFVSTSIGSGAGTPEWMAPEMIRCEPLDDRADVFSYGIILWELLTGEAPWENLNAMQVVGAVGFANKSLPTPTSGDPALIALCQACMAPSRSARPSFHQIVAALESHFSAHPLSAPSSGALDAAEFKPLLPAASAPASHPSPQPAAPPSPSHLQHALTSAAPEGHPSPSRHSITPLGRRRERSPGSADESPPAITTRLANGAKHPSPRLPTPTDPTFLYPLTPYLPHGEDRYTSSPVPQSPRHLASAHTHSGHALTDTDRSYQGSVPHSCASLPTPSPVLEAVPLDSVGSLGPVLSPFAADAGTPWASSSLRRSPSPTAEAPAPSLTETDFDLPPQPLVSPFAAYASAPTSLPTPETEAEVERSPRESMDADAALSLPNLPLQSSPFGVFADPPGQQCSTPFASSPPHAAPNTPRTHLPAAVDSPLCYWLMQAPPPAAGAAASDNDDPMQADGPSPPSHSSLSSLTPPHSIPLSNLLSTYTSGDFMPEFILPAIASAPAGCATAPAAASPLAVGMLTPFFPHHLADSAALQEMVLCAARASASSGATRLASPSSCRAFAEQLDQMPSMTSLDEKTRALLQYASNARCYLAGRFRVTSYDLAAETLSAPMPEAPVRSPRGKAPRSKPAKSIDDNDEDADEDAGLQGGSCTMYKRGRFFIKDFCNHKARHGALPKSVMLHTPSTGLVCTTSAHLLDPVLANCASPRLAGSPLPLRRTVSSEVYSSGCDLVPPASMPVAGASEDDDLYDQHSPAKTPRQHSPAKTPRQHSPAKTPRQLAADSSKVAAAAAAACTAVPPTSGAVGSADSAAGPTLLDGSPALEQALLPYALRTAKSLELPAVFECRQYNRGRFNVQENVVVKPPTSPPSIAPNPPSPPHPTSSSSSRPPASPPSAECPPSCRQAGRFTIKEQPPKPQLAGATAPPTRPHGHKPKASPRGPALPATAPPLDSSTAAAAVLPVQMGRFKVYERVAPLDTPRSRRSPRASGGSAGRTPAASPRCGRASGKPANDDPVKIVAQQAGVPAALGSPGSVPAAECSSAGDVVGSGGLACLVEVVCEGCQEYSIHVDVVMKHGSGEVQEAAAGEDDEMAVDVPEGAVVPATGGPGGGQGGEGDAMSSLLHLDLSCLR